MRPRGMHGTQSDSITSTRSEAPTLCVRPGLRWADIRQADVTSEQTAHGEIVCGRYKAMQRNFSLPC